MGAERPWEKSYPPGVRWDAPIETATLPALFDAFTAKWAAKAALEYRDRKTSFAELRSEVDAFASGLIDLGVGPGTSVALYLPNTPYHPISFFAVLKTGGRLVHLSPLDAERELAYKLRDSGARTLVTTNIGPMLAVAQKLQREGLVDHLIVGDDAAFGPSAIPTSPIADQPGLVRFETLSAAGAAKLPREWPSVSVDDTALLQYTGGTTGRPKGAMLSHANLSAACAIYKLWGDPQRLSAPGEDKVICVLPLFHIFALTAVLLRSLFDGNEVLLRLRFDVATTLQRHRGEEGDCIRWRADHVDRAGQHARHRQAGFLVAARMSASGGAALPVEVAERFHKLDRPSTRRRLGHDGDVARRHGHAARMHAQAGLGAACRCRASSWTSSRSTTRGACLRPARRARSASRVPTSRRATGTRPRRRPRPSSTAIC